MAQPKNCTPHNKGNISIFKTKANKQHGNYYNYIKSVYINSSTKLIITCPKHGDFEQTPAMHVSGHKCPKCAIEQRSKKRALGKLSFIQKALEIHKGIYEYSAVKYVNNRTKVDIYCTECNSYFKQNPDDHLNGHGCPNCCKYGIDITKPVTFYVLELINTVPVFKIGITNKTVKERYKSDNPNKRIKTILFEVAFLDGYDAILFEKQVKEYFTNHKYTGDTSFFGKTKNTEVLTANPLPYIKQAFQLKS